MRCPLTHTNSLTNSDEIVRLIENSIALENYRASGNTITLSWFDN